METGTQTTETVDTKQVEEELKREKVVKVRMNPKEFYLLSQVDEKLGFGNVSTTIRWLVEHYSELEKSKQLVDLARSQARTAKEFEKLAEEQ